MHDKIGKFLNPNQVSQVGKEQKRALNDSGARTPNTQTNAQK